MFYRSLNAASVENSIGDQSIAAVRDRDLWGLCRIV